MVEALKCPECGAHLEYKEGAKLITCKYCGNEFLQPPSLNVDFVIPNTDVAKTIIPLPKSEETLPWEIPIPINYYRNTETNENIYTYSEAKQIAFVCLRCGKWYTIKECGNCGHSGFHTGLGTKIRYTIFCDTCCKGFNGWTCMECNTDNPLERSLRIIKPAKQKTKLNGCAWTFLISVGIMVLLVGYLVLKGWAAIIHLFSK